jgi:hypothetical protein
VFPCLLGNWNILITFTNHQNAQLHQRTWMICRFCFFTSSSALYGFHQLFPDCSGSLPQVFLPNEFGRLRCWFVIFGFFQWESDQSFCSSTIIFHHRIEVSVFDFPYGSLKMKHQLSGKLSFKFDSATSQVFSWPKTIITRESLHWTKSADFIKCRHFTKWRLLPKPYRRSFTLWGNYLSASR